MDAVEFLKEWDRMCKSNEKCKECDGYKLCTSEKGICYNCEELVKAVENWSKTHPVFNLLENQKMSIRGRIAEGWNWVARDKGDNFVYFSIEKPYKDFFNSEDYTVDGEYSVSITNNFYDFVTFENSPLYLPDLLGGEE